MAPAAEKPAMTASAAPRDCAMRMAARQASAPIAPKPKSAMRRSISITMRRISGAAGGDAVCQAMALMKTASGRMIAA